MSMTMSYKKEKESINIFTKITHNPMRGAPSFADLFLLFAYVHSVLSPFDVLIFAKTGKENA